MKRSCNIIRDIIPLYVEKLSSEGTNEIVEEHISSCEDCKAYFESVKRGADITTYCEKINETHENDIEPLKRIEKGIKKKQRRIVLKTFIALLAVVIAFGLWIVGYNFFTSENRYDFVGQREVAEKTFNTNLSQIKESQQGKYLTRLFEDEKGLNYICIYRENAVFKNRVDEIGGTGFIDEGEMNFYSAGDESGDTILVFASNNLPKEAAYYTFSNNETTYTVPIDGRNILDIFVIPYRGFYELGCTPTIYDKDGNVITII